MYINDLKVKNVWKITSTILYHVLLHTGEYLVVHVLLIVTSPCNV